MSKLYLFVLLIACQLDNPTFTTSYSFPFPANFPVNDLTLTVYTKYWVDRVENEHGDVTESESIWLASMTLYGDEEKEANELYFLEDMSVFIGSNTQPEIPIAWTTGPPTNDLFTLKVDSSIELLDYAHVDSTYFLGKFSGTAPNHDVNAIVKMGIEAEGTWGQACSLMGGLGRRR